MSCDPFSDEAIRAASPEPIHTWRRALPGASDLLHVRAKSIRLGETATPTQSRESSLTSTDVVSIDEKAAAISPAGRRWQCVQRQITETERDVIEIINEYGPVVPVREIARLLDCDSEALRDQEIHRLQRDGFIESSRRGYALTEHGKAQL